MAEGRGNLAVPPKPAVEISAANEQLTSENSIPLSPQWLHAKPVDSKDARLVNFLSHGSNSDSVQKDKRRLDRSQDKWRRNVPEVESTRRWREEERETGLLGRRERKKESERENEYHKSDRRLEMRDSSDSRPLVSSDRWSDITNRSSGIESRRDSKWSSSWGPEEKEKDSQTEKKMDADKEDACVDKQATVGVTRALSISDSRDKWRPRHRHDVQSAGLAQSPATSGNGLDKGRLEVSNSGFAVGRGRPKLIGDLTLGSSCFTNPIGATLENKGDSLQWKSDSAGIAFCYPRGKLLDIYRKHKMSPLFDTIPEGLVEAPKITLSSSIEPLAFVPLDTDEEALLDDIWKGSAASSEICLNANTMTELDGSCKDQYSVAEAYKDEVNSLTGGADSGEITSEHSKDGTLGSIGVQSGDLPDSKIKIRGQNVVTDDGNAGHLDFTNKVTFSGTDSGASSDICAKLLENSNSVFSSVDNQEIQLSSGQHQSSNMDPLEELSFLYMDPQGEVQGPFLGVDIISWFDQGFFGTDLPVCLSDAPQGTPFQPLGEVMPHLISKSQFAPKTNPDDQQLAPRLCGDPLDYQTQAKPSDHGNIMDLQHGRNPVSNSDSSLGMTDAERQSSHDLPGREFDEVLYNGGSVMANNLHNLPPRSGGRETKLSSHEGAVLNNLHPLHLLLSELEGSHQKRPLSSIIPSAADLNDANHSVVQGDSSLSSHTLEPYSLVGESDPQISAYDRRNGNPNALQGGARTGHVFPFEQGSRLSTLEDQVFLRQLQKAQLHHHNLASPDPMHLTSHPFVEELQGAMHQQQLNGRTIPEIEHLLKHKLEQQQYLQFLQRQRLVLEEQQVMLEEQQQRQHQMKIREQHQRQQLRIQQFERQRLLESLYGASHADPVPGNHMLDELFLRERILHELQQWPHHLPYHHDPSLDFEPKFRDSLLHEHRNLNALNDSKHKQMLALEQQYNLGLQLEQRQGRQLSALSRQQLGREEETRPGQLLRAASQHHLHSAGPGNLEFIQAPIRTPTFENHSHLERNLALPEQIQRGHYDPGVQEFEMSRSRPASSPHPDVDLANVLARLQRLDMLEHHGQVPFSGPMAQFPLESHSQKHQLPNQFTTSHVDTMDYFGQLQNSNIDSLLIQSRLEAERHRRNMRVNHGLENSGAWASCMGDQSNLNHEKLHLVHQNISLQSPKSSRISNEVHTSSYENKESCMLSSRPGKEELLSLADTMSIGSTFIDPDSEVQVDECLLSDRLYMQSDSGHLIEPKQLPRHSYISKNNIIPEPLGGAPSSESWLDVDQGKSLTNFDSKVKIMTGSLIKKTGNIKGGNLSIPLHETGLENGFREEISNARIPGILPENAGNSAMKQAHDSNVLTSIKGRNSVMGAEGAQREIVGGNVASSMLETPASSKKAVSAHRKDADALEASSSFADMLKNTKNSAGADANSAGKNSKKKGRKGKQIDPSLLGFKVHSNRILMGEIQHPDD